MLSSIRGFDDEARVLRGGGVLPRGASGRLRWILLAPIMRAGVFEPGRGFLFTSDVFAVEA